MARYCVLHSLFLLGDARGRNPSFTFSNIPRKSLLIVADKLLITVDFNRLDTICGATLRGNFLPVLGFVVTVRP